MFFSIPRFGLLLAGISAAISFASVGIVSAEEWTDLRGTRTIEAKMVGMWGDNVVLQLQNGKRVTVNANALKSDSRIQARQLQRELAEVRTARIAELKGRATEAAMPAPNPLPTPPKTSSYQPVAAGQKVDAFLNSVDDQVRAGHAIAIYDALPPSYRADVASIVTEAAMKIDDPGWQATVGTLHQFGDVIVTHQRWFLSHPRITQLPTDALEMVEGELLTIAGAIRAGLSPDVTNLQTIQSGGFEKWIKQFDAATADYIAQAYRMSAATDRTITVQSETADAAVVTIETSAGKSKVTFQNVDGFWVPKSMADAWTDDVAAIKQTIADAPAGTLLAAVAFITAPIATATQPMTTASTEDAFHGAMESLFTSAETIIAAAGKLLGKDFSLARKSSNNGYGNSYDSDYGDDYEAEMAAQHEAEMAAQQGGR